MREREEHLRNTNCCLSLHASLISVHIHRQLFGMKGGREVGAGLSAGEGRRECLSVGSLTHQALGLLLPRSGRCLPEGRRSIAES